VLGAASVVDDLGFIAMSDLSTVLATNESSYRVIGGHMVTALVARRGLGPDLYRETGDTDLGVPPVLVRDGNLIDRFRDAQYRQIEGNRFVRAVTDIPVDIAGSSNAERLAVIDVLVPAYTSRPRSNRRITDHLVTTEVPGLAAALMRPPLILDLELHRLNGEHLEVRLAFPDEVAALVLKAFATRVRARDSDLVDLWRCLEVAFAAEVTPEEFADGEPGRAAAIVSGLFDRRDGPGMAGLVDAQRLGASEADRRFTRIRALIERVFRG
jgi:hypothetical protein